MNTKFTSRRGFCLPLAGRLKKTPSWLRLIFKLLIITYIILKLLGFTSILAFLFNVYYLIIYVLILSSLFIIYQLTSLYLIHKFSTQDIKIPDILPDFLISFLKEIEILKSSKSSIKEFKDTCYIQICIYLVIILFVLLFV